ncbi:MAG TPA: hypothetical protein VF329_13855 [Gammaproteobacteria bacterium]
MRRADARSAFAAAVAAAWVAFAVHGTAAAAEEPDDAVRDLVFGEVLFHFYREDYFAALTRLLAARARGELPANDAESELLLGGLWLSYGQHRLAGEIFERVLAAHEDPAVHDRAWFFLAKIWRQRGYLAEAEAALARIGGNLPPELEPARRLLEAQVLMDQGRFDDAEAVLEAWEEPTEEWVGYARYNLGVALVRLGRIDEGAVMLERVGAAELDETANEERRALRDKANVALGYAWLQAGRPAFAKPTLQRVRLDGPFSSKALLGVGWADAELADYRSALVPWLELKDRNVLDAAVQESLLAVPYAFAELGADAQAADQYLDAVAVLDEEIGRIDRSIEALRGGGPIDALLAQPGDEASGWYWRLERVPDTVESRYLYELLSTHRFQEALKSYRDLKLLVRNLDEWSASVAAFDDILDTRQRAYEQRLPAINRSLEEIDLERMTTRRVQLESRLTIIERTHDAVALGSPDQQRLWRELNALEPRLALLGRDAEADALRVKQRFLKGVLQWELERDYKARLWEEKAALQKLDLALKEAQARRYRVTTARDAWPERFTALTERVAALEPRLSRLQDSARAALERERRLLESMAIEELEARRERLSTYRLQARFSLAALYDRAAARAAPPTAEAAGEGS